MNHDTIDNRGRRPGQPMSDEQRKAMWASMGGGGGGGRATDAAGGSGSILPGGVADPGESPDDFNPYDTNWRPTSDAAEARRAAAEQAASRARVLSGRSQPTNQRMKDINARLRAAGGVGRESRETAADDSRGQDTPRKRHVGTKKSPRRSTGGARRSRLRRQLPARRFKLGEQGVHVSAQIVAHRREGREAHPGQR